MVGWITKKRFGPIGVDIGSRSVKLVQFSADQTRLIDAVRWEIDIEGDSEPGPAERAKLLTNALARAREGRKFRGREAVLCLGGREMFVQNIRVNKAPPAELQRVVQQEASGRLPFPTAEAEVRFLQAADVRQGDAIKREVILLACHRPVLEQMLQVAENAGLRPIAVDVEPAALLRCYVKQYRRDEDRQQRALFVHIGANNTVAVIAGGSDVLFVKYIDAGGRQLDEAVARHLKMPLAEAAALRRHNGDRRADQQDPEVARSVAEATRPVVDRLASELALCARYHSVTFRGTPLARVVMGGGEAVTSLVDSLAPRLDLKCELGDPLRSYETYVAGDRRGQWAVAAGLALRDFSNGQ
jgi:type IV pilus assembly protein PilM